MRQRGGWSPSRIPQHPGTPHSLLLPAQPQCQRLQERNLTTASLLPNHIHGPCQHPARLGTAGGRHQRVKGRDWPASARLLPAAQQATPTPQTHPPGTRPAVRHFCKHVKHFCHHPRGVGARRLSASSPAPRQKWGEWQRCCPGRPWWPPF